MKEIKLVLNAENIAAIKAANESKTGVTISLSPEQFVNGTVGVDLNEKTWNQCKFAYQRGKTTNLKLNRHQTATLCRKQNGNGVGPDAEIAAVIKPLQDIAAKLLSPEAEKRLDDKLARLRGMGLDGDSFDYVRDGFLYGFKKPDLIPEYLYRLIMNFGSDKDHRLVMPEGATVAKNSQAFKNISGSRKPGEGSDAQAQTGSGINGVTSNVDLEAIWSKLGKKDLSVTTIDGKHNDCCIINSDTKSGDGKHWTARYENYVYDPFGAPPDKRIIEQLKREHSYGMANTTQQQGIKENSCGYYCLRFLNAMSGGKSKAEKDKIFYDYCTKAQPRIEEFIDEVNSL